MAKETLQSFNSTVGHFVQLQWDGDISQFRKFLETIHSDFFEDGWGWDPLRQTIYVPGIKEFMYAGDLKFLACCTDRKKNDADRYLINSVDLNDFFKKL